MLNVRQEGNDIIFKIRVQPRAAKNEIVGFFQDALRLRVSAPPVEGKANKACCQLLAEKLGIPESNIKIISGLAGRNKQVRITGLNKEQLITFITKEIK